MAASWDEIDDGSVFDEDEVIYDDDSFIYEEIPDYKYLPQIDVLPLQKANSKALEELVTQKEIVEKFFVQRKKMQQQLKDLALKNKSKSVEYMGIKIVMYPTREEITKQDLTFNRFMACLAFTYYEKVASALDVKDLATNLIIPSLVSSLKFDKEVEEYRALCLGVAGCHFIPRMFFGRMKESDDSDTAEKYLNLVRDSITVCVLVDFVNYKKQNPNDVGIDFKKFVSCSHFPKETYDSVGRNFGITLWKELQIKNMYLHPTPSPMKLLQYCETNVGGELDTESRRARDIKAINNVTRAMRKYLKL